MLIDGAWMAMADHLYRQSRNRIDQHATGKHERLVWGHPAGDSYIREADLA